MTNNTALQELFDISPLLASIHERSDRLILVPNRRMLAKIKLAWRAHCVASCQVLPALRVFAIGDFLEQQYLAQVANFSMPTYQILTSAEEQHLWKDILQASRDELPMLKLASTADACINANNVLSQWLVDDFVAENDNHQYFQAWRSNFNDMCQRHAYINRTKLERETVANMQPKDSDLGALFVGFDSLTPCYKGLYQQLNGQTLRLTSRVMQEQLLSFADADQELNAAIEFLKTQLKDNPTGRFALIDPQLNQRREWIYQALSKNFAEHSMSTFSARQVLPINISAGTPALQAPILNILILIIALWERELDLNYLHSLCFTPFCHGADSEFAARQAFYLSIRRQNKPRHLMGYLRNKMQEICPILYDCVGKIAEQSRQARLVSVSMPLDQWLQYLDTAAATLGWPGQRETDSIEYQQLEHWQRIRDDLLAQTKVMGTLNIHTFKNLLRETLQNSVFQAKVEDSAIQVLGALEAANLNFDAMWIMSMDDSQFPGRPSPSPLLPLSLQSSMDMPHSSAARELTFANALLASWRASSSHITFSYARFKGDIKQRVSPLLQGLTSVAVASSLVHQPQQLDRFQVFEDIAAPALKEGEPVKGGAGILSAQAECPFKAFANYRLGVRQLDPVAYAVPASDRGTAIHRALEILFPKGLTKDELFDKQQGNLVSQEVDRAVGVALDYLYQQRPDIVTEAYKKVEINRINNILNDFIKVELERGFFEIIGVEQRVDTVFNGLPLHLRIDRLDHIGANQVMVIDYKTGSTSIAGWQGERPSDPQLLLYCLLFDDGEVSVVTKAAVNHKAPQYHGLSASDVGIKGVKTLIKADKGDTEEAWIEQKHIWQDSLTNLADEFVSGYAAVQPSGSTACQYCHLKDLCRIGERR